MALVVVMKFGKSSSHSSSSDTFTTNEQFYDPDGSRHKTLDFLVSYMR